MRNKGNSILLLYTLQNCIYCNWLKGKLNEENIQFTERIIDDGDINNSQLGDFLEELYQTTSYPIVEIRNLSGDISFSFISKTDLAPQDNLIIFETIDELIIKIKEKL